MTPCFARERDACSKTEDDRLICIACPSILSITDRQSTLHLPTICTKVLSSLANSALEQKLRQVLLLFVQKRED